MSPSARGLFLVAAAVALGVGILASIGKTVTPGSAPAVAVVSSSTTTTAPPSTTSTTRVLPTHSPSSVKVLVANGTSVSGAAGKLKTKLAPTGYDLLAPTDTTSPARASAVYYATGYQGDAQAIASAAGLGAGSLQAMTSQLPVSNSSGAEVIVVVGPDLVSSL